VQLRRRFAESHRAPGLEPSTALTLRALRFAHLLLLLVRLWVFARVATPRLAPAARSRAVQRWACRILAALGVEVRAQGHVPAADAALLIVANHVSWLDSYALNTVSAARFVAKSEVRGWPLIGVIATRFETIFLKRGCYRAAARVVDTSAATLRDARPVAVFPEGTTSEGNHLLRFFPALFQAAVLSGARVQPVAIRYRGADGASTDAADYVGDMSVFESLRRLLRESRVTAELIFCAPLDPAGRTRRELAALAHAAIAAALGRGGEALGSTPLRRAA
jgi:1-acyl-sn-glycerol-3-phosphate acyltransferase